MQNKPPYPKPTLAIDLCILTVAQGALRVVLMPRGATVGAQGDWALPGGFVHHAEALEATVARVLRAKTGLHDMHFEQLATYGNPTRDPREHVVSVVYLAICPAARLTPLAAHLSLAKVHVDWAGEVGGSATVQDTTDHRLHLAFDHAAILGDVVKRLRGKLDYTDIAFAFLPARFALRDVQAVHEAILGHGLTKPAFRRKLLDRGRLQPTGGRESGGAFRPAELYEVKQESE
jgi:8-oxo-dGTP diphosphatase